MTIKRFKLTEIVIIANDEELVREAPENEATTPE
jgi:hypothetical protein